MHIISPLNQAIIQRKQIKNINSKNNNQTQQTELNITTNNINSLNKNINPIEKTKNNKNFIITVLIGLTLTAIGLIIAYKKGIFGKSFSKNKNKEINHNFNPNTPKKNNINKILGESQKQYNDVMSLIEEGRKNNFQNITDNSGNLIIRFINSKENTSNKIMEEFNKGKTTRITNFTQTQDNTFEILSIAQYPRINRNNTGKIRRLFKFFNGRLQEYQEGIKIKNNQIKTVTNTYKIDKNQQLVHYKKTN